MSRTARAKLVSYLVVAVCFADVEEVAGVL